MARGISGIVFDADKNKWIRDDSDIFIFAHIGMKALKFVGKNYSLFCGLHSFNQGDFMETGIGETK